MIPIHITAIICMVSGIRSSTGSDLATLVAGVLPSTLGFGSANLGFGCRSDDIVQKQMTNFEKMEVNYDSIYISNKPAAVRRVLMMSRYPMPLTNQTSETQQQHEPNLNGVLNTSKHTH